MGETKERPILFSRPMVTAILEDRKTETRRIARLNLSVMDPRGPDGPAKEGLRAEARRAALKIADFQVGRRLWVREEHYRYGHWELIPGKTTRTGRPKWRFVADLPGVTFDPPAHFRRAMSRSDPATPAWHKRLARFMPRRMSRLSLEITAVGPERLQEIEAWDVVAEGVDDPSWHDSFDYTGRDFIDFGAAIKAFAGLWETINGPESWDANPYVYVVQFRRLES
ncbi:hypothetical protein [Planctomyces sp. SH-PL14]|uniref:hypothetical protein n=1 Tax=Planctomyces sp. SH-PL14 TaxID=1632864 RepID=UPI0012E7BB27|nr:hypothetical protein [Planctomyces sp. SH-PL14]